MKVARTVLGKVSDREVGYLSYLLYLVEDFSDVSYIVKVVGNQ